MLQFLVLTLATKELRIGRGYLEIFQNVSESYHSES